MKDSASFRMEFRTNLAARIKKKIGKKTWLDWFKNTANETTKVQGKLLEEKFLDWKKENAQTDDATVLIFENL